ncbi:peptidylprolyl isomerase [Streptomyces sp. 2131.1]|uniref:peptidylprolyl isomerase n=1 Tax=Streptomyces sp. 2131.1 TaxID=1855346 RepID=UPI002734E86C|nr:peptidylprolyl isomerase [Streptomyces sp. 2131.1]
MPTHQFPRDRRAAPTHADQDSAASMPSAGFASRPGVRMTAAQIPATLHGAAVTARRLYGRGLLAMANAGPNTNGSQFFVVYDDSALRPDYTVFGTVGAAGLKTLDKIAAGGIEPTAQDPAPVGGTPLLRSKLRTVRPSCRLS